MDILKCKICGGDVDVNRSMTFGKCQYCGTSMILSNSYMSGKEISESVNPENKEAEKAEGKPKKKSIGALKNCINNTIDAIKGKSLQSKKNAGVEAVKKIKIAGSEKKKVIIAILIIIAVLFASSHRANIKRLVNKITADNEIVNTQIEVGETAEIDELV